MTFVLLFSHRDLSFNKLNGEIPNLDGLTNVEVYSLAPSYMGYGGGHKSALTINHFCVPIRCLTGNRLNGNIPDGIKGRQSRTYVCHPAS
ncbi:hypothetical protein CK203_111171 [Vitis vinifera]|uniref:Uncharacterized protein n=1 Tax=Vitis vinifera TaxID=29760 RepID=A0A438BLW1_VITVI|nr:hypothetical protein CK203_111171 [Vitis vinifera]